MPVERAVITRIDKVLVVNKTDRVYHMASLKSILFLLIAFFYSVTALCTPKPLSDSIQVFSKLNYYTTEPFATVVCMLPSDRQNKLYDLQIFNGAKPVSMNVSRTANKIEANIALTDTGIYTYNYRVVYNEHTITSGMLKLIKLLPVANEVKIDRLTGGLITDGSPFFPFGFYCGPVGDLPDQEVLHGFNMIGPYQNNLPAGLPERKSYMDRCAAIGIKVQYGVNSLIGSGHNGSKGLDRTDEEKLALLKQEVLAFKDHPALLSWYINDEPDGQGRPPEVLEKAYRIIKQLDPYHPVSIVFMMPSKIGLFKNTMDIAMTDSYPIPGPVEKVGDDVAYLKKELDHERPVWLVPQAFGGQEMWPREPTGKEIRAMTYLGLLKGATGIQYFIRAPSNKNPQSVSAWSACSDMAVEFNQMAPFLLSEEVAPAVTVNNPALVAKAYWHKNYMLLVVVNTVNEPADYKLAFTPPRTALIPAANLWFENREIPVSQNSFTDMIDAYGTRVYLLSPQSQQNSLSIPGNLTYNPGFEKVTSPGLPAGFNSGVKSNEKADPAATVFADTRQTLQGLFSLRFITPADDAGTAIKLTPFVVNAGNSYSVSVWAKAKQAERMPRFSLAIEDMGITESFNLDTTWRKYSFTIEPKTASANTLLSLRLDTRGTAWFDMLQVNADPVIQYAVTPGGQANVSLISYTANSTLKYTTGKSDKPLSYNNPVAVTAPTLFTARLFVKGVLVGQTQKFIPVSKALNRLAKTITPAAPQYPGHGSSSLTDGLMASAAFKDPNWLGFTGPEVVLQVDLQKRTAINKLSVNILCDPNSGIFLPKAVEFYTSEDGVNFKPAGMVENKAGSVRGEPYVKMFSITPAQKQGRYIKIKALSIGEIPAQGYLFPGTNPWIFIDEIMVE